MEDPVYIIGHRNPDADAICSALGYADYKRRKTGSERYVAARCGNSNARIDAILNRFGVALPRFIGDVTPRVRDIMIRDVIKVSPDSVCAEALDLIDRHDLRVLPVVEDCGRLHGTVSIFALGEFFIPRPRQEKRTRNVHTSIRDIVKALDAEVVHAVEPERIENLYVRVAAMDLRSFGKAYISDRDIAASSVIIVGDRYDIQQKSIQTGVRLLVITGGLAVEPDVVEMARQRGVSIIISPNDSATTSWLIRSARRIDDVIQPVKMTFSADEKLIQVRRKIATLDAQAFMVVDDEQRLVGVFSKTDLLKPIPTRLILMDHNELTQAVPGADQVPILEVIDHHRLGNQPTEQPIFFLNSPVGSTSTIVADLYRRDGITPPTEIAGVLMGGIISDTLNLRGPTSTKVDEEILAWLAEIARVPADELAHAIFTSGSVILSATPEQVIRTDMKIYDEAGLTFSVSQVEELGFGNFWDRREALVAALEAVRDLENLDFAALLVTDINRQNSVLMIAGPEDIVAQITYPRHDSSEVFELNGVVSRKKQLIPYLSSLLRTGVGTTS